jgi:hypothetical protein
LALALLCGAALNFAQSEKKLTARELFYTPIPQRSDVQPKAQRPKPQTKTGNQAPKPAAVKTVPEQTGPTSPETAEKRPLPKREPPVPDALTRIQNVSTAAALPPLALRYSVLKRGEPGFAEVDPESIFRSGDRIRVSVEANDSGYLYIVQQGSSKAWNVLFPNEETAGGNNHIERNRAYTIPGGTSSFVFDTQPGIERVFIILSRRPEPDMEKLIYSLTSTPGKQPASAPEPKDKPEPSRVLIASTKPIEDSVINRLRTQLMARDLVFEKVDESKTNSGKQREHAMYVATPDRTPDARVVVDLKLRHE